MAAISSHLFYLVCLLQSCVADVWFADDLHFPITVEEGSSHLVTIETSFPDYQLSSATVHVVTLQEYELLANNPNFMCNMSLANSEILRIPFNNIQPSPDLTEDTDFSEIEYSISFNSGVATFSLEVADDDTFENDEFFVLYIDIPEPQMEMSGCATLVKIRDNDRVNFTWSVQRMNVYEDEGTIYRLKILKHGTNEHNVTVDIQVNLGNDIYEAQYGVDYRLFQTTFVFHHGVTNLSVPIEVYDDRIGEIPEHFYLGFTNQCRQGVIDCENGVTIYILDRINFTTQPQNVSAEYGDTVTIRCRTTSTTLPKWTIGYPNGTISQYLNTAILPVFIGVIPEGISVSVTNLKYNLTNYTCIIDHIVPNPTSGIFKSVPLRSRTGILTIVFPSVTFHLASEDDTKINTVYIRKGETINLKIVKNGGENYSYNVTLYNTADLSILTQDMFFVLDSSTEEKNVTIKIPHYLWLEDTLQFKIIIDEVSATGYGRIDVDTGEPINVTLYDNDYVIQFKPSNVILSAQSIDKYNICASITKPSIVDPQITIPLMFESVKECLIFEMKRISLNSSNETVCLTVQYDTHNANCCRNFTIQPQRDQPKGIYNYSVTLKPQSINFTSGPDCYGHGHGGLSEGIKATIGIVVSVIVLALVAFIISIIVYMKYKQELHEICKQLRNYLKQNYH